MVTGSDTGLWTLSEVAQFLGVKRRIVTTYVSERGLPVIRITRNCVRVDPRALQEWLAKHSEGATADDVEEGAPAN